MSLPGGWTGWWNTAFEDMCCKIVAVLDTPLTLDRLDYHISSGDFYKMGVLGKDVEILATIALLLDK